MDRETAIRIWDETPGLRNVVTGRSLEEFANRVLAEGLRELRADFDALKDRHEADVLAEREACALLCEVEGRGHRDGFGEHCAAIIRMRSNV
jgi:hypothetical protein